MSTTYVYDTAHGNHGNLYSVTDANSHTITYQWTNGRISQETNTIPYSISRTISSNGTIASETNGRGTGYTTSFLYDDLLRPTRKTPPAGNRTDITYPNADGSIRRETRGGYVTDYTFDGFGRPSGSSDSKGVTTTIAYTAYGTKDYEDTNIGDKVSYDYFGRVKEILHKDTNKITYIYGTTGANETTITDEKLKNTKLTYKAFGNPDEKYLMSVYDAALKTTTYTRNIQGNLTGITQGSISGNFTRSFGYDTTKKNFLTSETNPETGTITYGRDNVGNMTSRSGSSNLTYLYDDINRLTDIYETANPTNKVTFGYDNANNRTSMIYPGGSAGYVPDAINRITQKTETISGRSYTTGFSYDGNDNLQTITYPSSRVVTYGYNGLNQVTSITGFGSSITSVQYFTNAAETFLGQLKSYVQPVLPSGSITTNFTYNSRNLTTAITAGSALNVGYGYTDPRGNTTSYTNSFYGTQNYDYDDLSRLTSFSGSWGSGSFVYDDSGNRSTKTVGGQPTSYSYSSNRVSSTSGLQVASYSYRTDGLLSGGTWDGLGHTLNYDKFDNLTSLLAGATTLASFAYDGDGQRVSKTANGNKTVYHYDLGGRTLSEDDGSGNQIADYIYLHGKLVAKVAAVPVASVTPSTANFGNIYVNSTSVSQTVTVQNTGSAALVIGTLSFSGVNSSEFIKSTDTCSGQTLAVSSSCTVQVSFAPTSSGAKTANLAIPSNDPVTPTFNVSLNGTGVLPTLSVTKSGTGTGTITSAPAGISCGQNCSASYTTGTSVALTAAPDTDSTFTGWSGGGCSGAGSCIVTMNANTTVTPTFALLPPVADFSATPTSGVSQLTVNFTDNSQRANSWLWNFGDGTTSTQQSPSHTYTAPGIYTVSLQVTNTVSGSNTMTKNNLISVSASLTISKAGTGTGTVTSIPAGISCGSTCFAALASGTQITLQAVADSNSSFSKWSGGLCAGTGDCSFTLSGDMSTTATFALLPAASFSSTLSSGSAPATATFIDSSANTTSWLWNFGDGSTSMLQNPAHVYNSPGSYAVSLTAINAAGSNTTTQTITVTGCATLPVRIGSTYYATIQAAYDAAADGDTVQILALDFTENLSAGQGKYVTLDGGYLCGFPDNPPDMTNLIGTPHISSGTTRMRNIHIR